MPKRLLITGSRNWDNPTKLMVPIIQQWIKWKKPKDAILVSGHCPTGADHLAEEVWDELGLEIEFHPARWDTHGKQAGFVRNREMVELGADVCMAFFGPCVAPSCPRKSPHPSHGATHTLELAMAKGIKCKSYML